MHFRSDHFKSTTHILILHILRKYNTFKIDLLPWNTCFLAICLFQKKNGLLESFSTTSWELTEPCSSGSWNDCHKLSACPAKVSEFNIRWNQEQVSLALSGFSLGLWLDVHYRKSSVTIRYSCPGAACCNPTAQLVEKFMWLYTICSVQSQLA